MCNDSNTAYAVGIHRMQNVDIQHELWHHAACLDVHHFPGPDEADGCSEGQDIGVDWLTWLYFVCLHYLLYLPSPWLRTPCQSPWGHQPLPQPCCRRDGLHSPIPALALPCPQYPWLPCSWLSVGRHHSNSCLLLILLNNYMFQLESERHLSS